MYAASPVYQQYLPQEPVVLQSGTTPVPTTNMAMPIRSVTGQSVNYSQGTPSWTGMVQSVQVPGTVTTGINGLNGISKGISKGGALGPVLDDGTGAVFLQQYFQLIKAHCDTALINKPAAVRQLNGKLFPLIVEAFQRHDKDGDGVLSKAEANIFFSLFVSERLGFVDAARGLATQFTGDSEKAAAQILLYQRFKDVTDSRAFEVFDSNEDGYLQLHEAVAAMSIGSEKNEALMKAFGLRSDDGDVDDAYWADHYA
eukprot:symbB.v1.2.012549.t1/scaffold819.1/size162441/20